MEKKDNKLDLENEILKINNEIYQLSDQQFNEVVTAYQNSLERITELISKLYAKYAEDGVLEYSELIKLNRFTQLQQNIQKELQKLEVLQEDVTTDILENSYENTYYMTLYELDNNISTTVTFTLLNTKAVEEAIKYNWSGQSYSSRIWKNLDNLRKSLKETIVRGVIDGESVDKMAKLIKDQFDSTTYQAKRLVNTELANVISSATEKAYQESGVTDGYQWSATLEGNTCPICAKNDGKIWGMDENRPKIPRHPSCRCSWIPYFKDLKYKTRKDNETKKIIKYKNYDEWYKEKVN